MIDRCGAEDAVVMSESEFNAWKETIYLMSTPNNTKRLLESIVQAECGDVLSKVLVD